MGKIIKDGFQFMERVNSHLIRKIDDIPELKHELIALGETKTYTELSKYAVLLAEHILVVSGASRTAEIEACLSVNARWQNKEARFQEARDVAGVVNALARNEKNQIMVKVLRMLGQVAAVPHVKWHALVASEYAVVVINLMYPDDLDKVREERETQIRLMKNENSHDGRRAVIGV